MIKLICGLGNPGLKYRWTRHNLGFLVLEEFAAKNGLSFKKEQKFLGHFSSGKTLQGKECLLLMPSTYMNESGKSINSLLAYYKLLPENVLVVCDDMAIGWGQLRLRRQGSSGGHNGLRSVENHLRTPHYPRLRIGIGSPLGLMDKSAHVLGNFTFEEKQELDSILQQAVACLESCLQLDLDDVANQFNQKSTEKK